ncbi:hypothetical protein GCM10023100_10580 [Actinocorallia cavernae]|uniref:Uncharacterized protein n=2 Tax=Actinomycetes TaxID=1760 RepID=A0ABN3M1S5_9ACTN
MGDAVPEMHEGGKHPVSEDQFVLRPGTHDPLPRPVKEYGLMPLVPQRTDLCHEFSDHLGCRPNDPSTPENRCTRLGPHHTGHDH